MRSENAIKNIAFNLGGQIIGLILSFICRSIFVRMLSESYLGVNGLFTNILSVLSLAELGVGSAIVFSMYNPIASEDNKKINLLMNLYKKAYTYIGLIVIIIGVCVVPFLKYLIKDMTVIPNITIIYLMYVANTGISYFISYKRSIITAHQKMYICSIVDYSIQIIQYIIQIVVLIFTQNFIFYLGVQIVCSLCSNLIISYLANKMYPYIQGQVVGKLDLETKKEINKNIFAMFNHRIGGVIVTNTDNILMSAFVGLASVGIYSNYNMVILALNNLTSQIFNALTASVGNLGAVESKSYVHSVYNSLNFIAFWIFSFCSICLFVLFNPFIELWLGDKFLFPMGIVFIICTNFYLMGMRKVSLVFRDALGLFWYNRYKPILEATINLIVSIVLVKNYGILGIFVGTITSTLLTSFWMDPYVVYKYGFKHEFSEYLKNYFKYTMVTLLAGTSTFIICSFNFFVNQFMDFVFSVLLCCCIPNIVIFTVFKNTLEYSYFLEQVNKIVKRRNKL